MNRRFLLVYIIAMLLVVGCGGASDDADTLNNHTGNNGDVKENNAITTNNQSENSSDSNHNDINGDQENNGDAHNSVSNNDNDTNNSSIPTDPNLINSLSYFESLTTACPLSSCGVEIRISLLAGQIWRFTDGTGYPVPLDPEDIEYVSESVFTNQTYEKLMDGWECADIVEDDTREIEYFLDARALDGDDYEQVLVDITGCVEAGDEDVLLIADIFKDMADKYFD